MAQLRGLIQVLNDETAIFAFLPTANATYLLILSYSDKLLGIGVGLAITSTFFYLVIDTNPNLDPYKRYVQTVFALWALGYLYTVCELVKLLSRDLILPEVLTLAFVAFVSLLISDKLLDRLDDDYEPTV